jgi:hypothetical protein
MDLKIRCGSLPTAYLEQRGQAKFPEVVSKACLSIHAGKATVSHSSETVTSEHE